MPSSTKLSSQKVEAKGLKSNGSGCLAVAALLIRVALLFTWPVLSRLQRPRIKLNGAHNTKQILNDASSNLQNVAVW